MFFSLEIKDRQIKIDGAERFVRQETQGSYLYVLVGRVYGEEHTDLPALAEKLQTTFLAGRYFLIKLDQTSGQFVFWIDKYRLLNAQFQYLPNGIRIGNMPILSKKQNTLAIESFRMGGAVIYPLTFFENLTFITGNGKFNKTLSMNDHALSWPEEGESPSPEGLAQLFKKVTADIYHNWSPQIMRLSGGADTRMIALSLPAEALKKMEFQVLCHPQLSPEEDRDVLGAQMIADLLGVSLKILRPTKESYNYVGAPKDQQLLGGIYGGEFLGGFLHRHTPLSNPNHLEPGFVRHAWDQRYNQLGWRRFQTELFLSSFRSTIYDSVQNSWADPWVLNQFCKSPFVEQEFLDALLSSSYQDIQDYQLYAKVYRLITDKHQHLPLSSPLVQMQPGFSSFQEGREPKSIELPTDPLSPEETRALNLKSILE